MSKMDEKVSLCGGYSCGEGLEESGEDRKITEEIKTIFPAMVSALRTKTKTTTEKQTQQGDPLGDFLGDFQLYKEEGKV